MKKLDLSDKDFTVSNTSKRTVFEGAVWSVAEDKFDFSGSRLTRQYVDHPGSVAIVAVDSDGRVLLQNQYRHPIGRKEWELPAGLLDVSGEPAAEAARRELAEESDLEAVSMLPLLSIVVSPGGSSEEVQIFLAVGLTPVKADFLREGEEAELEHAWFTFEEVEEAIFSGKIKNAVLIAGTLAAKRYLSL